MQCQNVEIVSLFRIMFPEAVIERNEGKDKVIRSARVQLPSKKMLNRPISLLYPLECSSGNLEVKQQKNTATSSKRSKQTI